MKRSVSVGVLHAWSVVLVGMGLILTAPSVRAQAKLTVTQEGQRTIKAQTYEAVVASDGCLTHLKVLGEEFLAPGVAVSRGSYFYQGAPLKLQNVEQPTTNVIVAQSDKASIRYEFGNTGMVWTAKNKSNQGMVFLLVLHQNVQAVKNDQGRISLTVIAGQGKHTVWYRNNARLEITGSDRLWGPWQRKHQVWEASLQPGDERRIEFTAGEIRMPEKAEIIKQMEPPPQADLLVLSPRNYQVFQRRTRDEGPALISGRTGVEADTVEARITGQPLHGKIKSSWRPLLYLRETKSFTLPLTLPAGGWYRLEVRARKGKTTVAEAVVEKFGMGEVFVGAGQSNSTNSGEFPTSQTSGMVSSFGGESWQLANDPQPGTADHSTGGSFWPAFGDVMYAKYKVPIGVATTGFGGTSVNQWQPDGDLFRWTMTRIYQLGPQGFRALLWHQGESDVPMEADEYYTKLRRVIVASKAMAGWEFPWVVAQVSYHNPDNPSFPTTRAAQKRLWEDGIALEGPDTDTLTGDHRDLGGKGIHFSPKGLKAHGEMWADKVGAYLDKALDAGD